MNNRSKKQNPSQSETQSRIRNQEAAPKVLTEEEKRKASKKCIENMCIMDNIFMSKFFEDNIECIQFVLRIIMNKDDLIVKEAETRHNMENLHGHSVEMDIYATDKLGKKYNIEFQKANDGANVRRARYYSSIIDTNTLVKNEEYKNLPDTYVIFITENDVFKGSKPLYHFERRLEDTYERFNDGSHIIYVNGENDDNTALGKLMQDFVCTSTDKMCYNILKERSEELKGYKKHSHKEEKSMSKATQEFYELAKGQGEITGRIKDLTLIMKNLNCTLEEAFKTLEITDKEVQNEFRKYITT